MVKRVVTRVGDIFCAEIGNEYKCYFQYMAKDSSLLYSAAIRVFKTRYPMDYEPDVEDIVKDEVLFYTHTFLRTGLDAKAWYKVGKSKELGLEGLKKIVFGHASTFTSVDSGAGIKLVKVNPLDNWSIWRVNEESVNVGNLPEEYRMCAEIGAVFSYGSITERLKYGYFMGGWSEYDVIKRRPISGVNSYAKRIVDGNECYFHYIGEDISRELILKPQGLVKLTTEFPSSEGCHFHAKKFWEINWKFQDFITEEEFNAAWNEKK